MGYCNEKLQAMAQGWSKEPNHVILDHKKTNSQQTLGKILIRWNSLNVT